MMEEGSESEIVRLTTLGYGNIEIVEKLGISPKTVELCLKNRLIDYDG
ncbi:response regulator transcription factor [Exiguobacterium sp. SH0S1]|nr:response regulator transcription factor [Exiguobacterium sp. SH0S1]